MIGQLKERLVIQQQIITTDAGGGQQNTWQDLPENAVIWAALKPKKAEERYAFQQIGQAQTHLVKIRYRADMTANLRLRKGTRIFAILSVYDQDENGRYLYLNCQEKQQVQP